MAGSLMREMIMMVMLMALAGCTNADAPPGTPGSLTAHMNGRMQVSVGVGN